jgi:hypothetical protein
MKKILLFLTLFLVAATGINTAQAQTRHAFLEVFTGSWCGFCVRGDYALQQLEAQYPGQIIPVCYHVPGSATELDPMETLQGDSLNAGIGYPVSNNLGCPDGWGARMVEPTNGDWNVFPIEWDDSEETAFGLSLTTDPPISLAPIITAPATVQCTVDNVSFDASTQTVTARVTGTFSTVMSGDFRLNLMVIEDSVSGPSGSDYDQHNYYSSQDQIGAQVPGNPMYSQPYDIAGFQHLHVFREAVGGVLGVDGIIPATTTAGGVYSKTFTFVLPTNVLNPNRVKLVGIVNQYSATDATANEVFDAMQVPLSTTPIAFAQNQISVIGDNGLSTWAHAGGDTTLPLTVQNGGSNDVTVTFQMDPLTPLPTGWSVKFTPPSIPLAGGASSPVTMTITAPEQSSYITANVIVLPKEEGVSIAQGSFSFTALSDNTAYALYYDVDGEEAASFYGLPDTMGLHTAVMPWINSDILNYFDPSQPGSPVKLAMFTNVPFLDGAEAEDGYTSSLPTILNLLSENIPVYISSNDAFAYAFVGNANTETDAVQGFFNDSLGINFKSLVSRINSAGTEYVSFQIDGTTDPIGAGMKDLMANSTGTIEYADVSGLFSLENSGPSTALLYTDGIKTDYTALKCASPTGWRVVYMGIGLNALGDQTDADTIFKRSIQWLLSAPPAAVNTPAAIAASGITASPNPFHGTTEINYVASQDEQNVTLAAYDVLGREVQSLLMQSAGNNSYNATFDGSQLPDGTYAIVAHSSKGTSQVRVVNQQ